MSGGIFYDMTSKFLQKRGEPMNATIIVRRPNLTEEERAMRMENLRAATVRFFQEVYKTEMEKQQKEGEKYGT